MPISNTSGLTGYPAVWLTSADRRLEKQFTAVERTGYLTVSELIRDFLTDAVTGEAAFRIANVSITETYKANSLAWSSNNELFQQNDVPFPPTQRIRKIVNGGAGYAVGDELYFNVNNARSNVKIVVTKVNTESVNEVLDFEVHNSGHYNLDTPSATKRFEFRVRKNEYISPVLQKDISYENYGSDKVPFEFMGRHSGNGYVGGTAGPTVSAPSLFRVQKQTSGTPFTNKWEQQFGTIGRGGSGAPNSVDLVAGGGSTDWGGDITVTNDKTRWPVDGLWANIQTSNNTVITAGVELVLDKPSANNLSFIDPGTVITSIGSIEVVNGVKSVSLGGTPSETAYFEKTGKYVYFTTNKPVRVDKGDKFYIKGNGLIISDNTTEGNTPDYFKVICESQARIDPHAENKEAVVGKVNAINGNVVHVVGLYHAVTSWYPVVFEGHEIESNTTGAYLATVSNVANIKIKTNYAGEANIVTDTNLSPSLLNQNVKFRFSSTQSWRMAFEAAGPQTMNVFTATAVQLRDNGNIARVTDYLGTVTDVSGVAGNVWSIPVLSTTSTERVKNIDFSVTGGATGTGNAFLNITTAVSSSNIDGWPDNKIQPGWMIDYNHHTVFSLVKDSVVLEQVLPLISGEQIGGKGRYKISNVYLSSTAISVTGGNIAKVKDRRVDPTDITQGFVNRSLRVQDHPQSYPLSYFASFTNRGLFFGIWEGSWSIMQKTRARQISERDAWFNWILVQRPVNRKTGFVRTSGQSPVFCINSVGYRYWKFVVRERDVMHPTQGDSQAKAFYYNDLTDKVEERTTPFRVPADAHTDDSHAIINSTNQIALTEDSKYLVSFLYNLTTPRFRYSDELDMVGQTAGDVSMASSDIKITAYGEATQRVYKSLSANLPYNAGLRICVLKDIYTS